MADFAVSALRQYNEGASLFKLGLELSLTKRLGVECLPYPYSLSTVSLLFSSPLLSFFLLLFTVFLFF